MDSFFNLYVWVTMIICIKQLKISWYFVWEMKTFCNPDRFPPVGTLCAMPILSFEPTLGLFYPQIPKIYAVLWNLSIVPVTSQWSLLEFRVYIVVQLKTDRLKKVCYEDGIHESRCRLCFSIPFPKAAKMCVGVGFHGKVHYPHSFLLT